METPAAFLDHRITDSAMARELAAKSHEARRNKRGNILRLEAKLDKLERLYAVKPEKPQLPDDIAEELRIVNEQIAHARKALNDKTPWCPACERLELQPHHRAQLMKSLDTFLDRRRILLNRPLLAAIKPPQQKPLKRAFVPIPEPIPIESTTELDQPAQIVSGDWADTLF